MHPLKDIPLDRTNPWYTQQCVGVSTLKAVLPMLSEESGCVGRYTDHCLQATAMSRMFSIHVGVPEKVIADKSGNHSIEALLSYEGTATVNKTFP